MLDLLYWRRLIPIAVIILLLLSGGPSRSVELVAARVRVDAHSENHLFDDRLFESRRNMRLHSCMHLSDVLGSTARSPAVDSGSGITCPSRTRATAPLVFNVVGLSQRRVWDHSIPLVAIVLQVARLESIFAPP